MVSRNALLLVERIFDLGHYQAIGLIDDDDVTSRRQFLIGYFHLLCYITHWIRRFSPMIQYITHFFLQETWHILPR